MIVSSVGFGLSYLEIYMSKIHPVHSVKHLTAMYDTNQLAQPHSHSLNKYFCKRISYYHIPKGLFLLHGWRKFEPTSTVGGRGGLTEGRMRDSSRLVLKKILIVPFMIYLLARHIKSEVGSEVPQLGFLEHIIWCLVQCTRVAVLSIISQASLHKFTSASALYYFSLHRVRVGDRCDELMGTTAWGLNRPFQPTHR